MYRTKHLLSKTGGMENRDMIDSKGPFCKPPGQGLNFQVLADWQEGAPAWAPRIVNQLKTSHPYRSFGRPFAKSIVLQSVFTLLHICPRTEEARSMNGRPAGQTDFRKSVKK